MDMIGEDGLQLLRVPLVSSISRTTLSSVPSGCRSREPGCASVATEKSRLATELLDSFYT